MKLVMFDLDGTLTDTYSNDDTAFVRAVRGVLGADDINTDWGSYRHATCEGILDEIARAKLGRPVTPGESRAVQRRCRDLIHEEAQNGRFLIREVPGAARFVQRLREAGCAVALASGDWELTARYKLAAAAIPADGLPAAFCDSSPLRTDIMRLALRRAHEHFDCPRFERLVYIGDGGWDVKATRELGWAFIGIELAARPVRLRALGAGLVFADFQAPDRILDAIDRAEPPGP